ncbi:MAG: AAA family ATPase [Candidatus Acidiferrales bacterium]
MHSTNNISEQQLTASEEFLRAGDLSGDPATAVPQPDENGEFACPADGARFMAALGIPQVPLRGKSPQLGGKNWQHHASTDPTQIDAWAKKFRGCNFGSVALPKLGGFFMMEADAPTFRERHMKDTGRDFTKTLTIQSRPGRGHRYYAQTSESLALGNIGQNNRVGDFSLRADHEMCVSPGSIHPETEKQYRVVVNVPPVAMSKAEIAWLRTQRKARANIDLAATGPKIPYGQHDDFLFKAACKLRGMLEWDEAQVAAHLLDLCVKRCENYGSDYREMCAAKAKQACKFPPGSKWQENFKSRSTSPTASDPGNADAPSLRTGNQITMKSVRWFWPARVPLGKLTIFAGNPDNGKSLVTTWLAATCTVGGAFPDDVHNATPPSNVLMLIGEDDIDDTVLPRLYAAGADVSKIIFLEAMRTQTGDDREVRLDYDMHTVENQLKQNPAIRMVVVDPISNYLGKAKMVDEQEVRSMVLIPLKGLAAKYNVAVVLVMHLNKKPDLNAISRVGGAMAFTGVARASWLCQRDEADDDDEAANSNAEDTFSFVPIKNNLARRDQNGLSFTIAAKRIEIPDDREAFVPYVVWGGAAKVKSADTALGTHGRKERSAHGNRNDQSLEKAKRFILEFLADGEPKPSALLVETAKQRENIGRFKLQQAKETLPVEVFKDGAWFWRLKPVHANSQTVAASATHQSDFVEVGN